MKINNSIIYHQEIV